jgi:hypothetical protein
MSKTKEKRERAREHARAREKERERESKRERGTATTHLGRRERESDGDGDDACALSKHHFFTFAVRESDDAPFCPLLLRFFYLARGERGKGEEWPEPFFLFPSLASRRAGRGLFLLEKKKGRESFSAVS